MNRAGTGRITLAANSLGISAQGPSTHRFAIFLDLNACIGNLRQDTGFPLYAFSLLIVCFGIYQIRAVDLVYIPCPVTDDLFDLGQ